MAKLGVLDVEGTAHTLRHGETYLIGLKSKDYLHDIEIDDKSVDIRHCILDFTEKSPKLIDVKSKCGTYVDGTRVAPCQVIPIRKSSTIQIGNVETTLQLANESDSGYLDARLSPPVRDGRSPRTSPLKSALGSQSQHVLGSSLTSTPKLTANSSVSLQAIHCIHEFVVPECIPPRQSTGSNASFKSGDSFFIPETQYPSAEHSKRLNDCPSKSSSFSKSKSRLNSTAEDDDDFFIPETQEVASATTLSDRLSKYPRLAFAHEDINETVPDDDKIPSSQFQICTQDFNASDEDASNNSDDILANVPSSLVIPAIRHSTVQIDEILELPKEDELLALQWSKRTADSDDLVSARDSVTPDVVTTREVDSQRSTPDIFADPANEAEKEHPPVNEPDLQPTQLFVKPAPVNRSVSKASISPCNKENVIPSKDDADLAPTQVFMRPADTPKATAVTPSKPSLPINDEDLPPTQVFQAPAATLPTETPSKDNCLSSTAVNPGTQPFENSFKAKCNKLLDSDDDEMDAVVAPELVKKMRESLKSPESNPPTTESSSTTTPVPSVKEMRKTPKSTEKTSPPPVAMPVGFCFAAPVEKSPATPEVMLDVQFVLPETKSKKKPPLDIDHFLCTPDFIGKEFSKDEKLQKLADENWKNQKNLYEMEDSEKPLSSDTDHSNDSFNDLLPQREKRRKQQKPSKKSPKKSEDSSVVAVEKLIRRRRPSALEKLKLDKKLPNRSISETIVETAKNMKKALRAKRRPHKIEWNSESTDIKTDPIKEKNSKSDKNLSHVQSMQMGREKIKLRRMAYVGKSEAEHGDSKPPSQKGSDGPTKYRTRQTQKDPGEKTSSETKTKLNQNKDRLKADGDNNVSESRTGHKPKAEGDNASHDRPAHKLKAKLRKISEHINATSTTTTTTSTNNNNNNSTSDIKEAKPHGKVAKKGSVGSAEKDHKAEKEETKKKDSKKEKVAERRERESIEDKEEKPLPRITRLRSGMDPAQKPEKAAGNRNKSKSIRSEKAELEKSIEKKLKAGASLIDLTDSDKEEKTKKPSLQRSGSKTSNKVSITTIAGLAGTKRKNEEEDIEQKRLKTNPSASCVKSPTKEARRLRPQEPKIKIAMTMCDPRYQEVLEKHSGVLWNFCKDPRECDVLVVEKGNRTYKLLIAIARGIPVVNLDWLIEVLRRRCVSVPYEEFIFQDQLFQERHQFVMRKSLFLARTSRLFKGISFMMTPGIRPVPEEMRDIIICAGGTVLEQVPKVHLNQRLYLISQVKDNQHWHRYRRANINIKIVTTEGIMASVMQQSEAPLHKSIIQ